MKKAYLFFALAFVVVAFSSCNEEKTINAPIEKISFGFVPEDETIRAKYNVGEDGVFVGVNNTKVTSVVMEPASAKWPQVTYSSANDSIVTIGPDGLLTGVGRGQTEVYAQIENGLKATLKVYVDTISITKIDVEVVAKSFNDYNVIDVLKDINGKDSLDTEGKEVSGNLVNADTLFLNDIAVMQVTTEPMEASFSEMVWTTSDSTVFQIKGDTIVAIKEGSATITGRLKQNHHEELTQVYNWVVKTAKLERVVWGAKTKKMYANTSEEVMPLIVFLPSYASDKEVVFESSDENVFNVANGKVYCYQNSDSTIVMTVKSKNYWQDMGENEALNPYKSECKFKVRK